jgi:hypothetical protein
MASENYIVVTVSSIIERDRVIKKIYTNLKKEPDTRFVVQQDQVNRVKVLQYCGGGVYVPIRTYVVIVIPVLIDLSPLYSFQGTVDYHLEETIEHLQKLTTKLQSLSGRKVMKGISNEQAREQLARELHNLSR